MDDITRAGVLSGFSPLVQSLGRDPAGLLGKVGLSPGDLDDPDQYLPRAAVIELLEQAAKATGCADFGLRLADWQDVSVLGAIAFLARKAPDLRSAIGLMIKYKFYQAPAASISLQPGARKREECVAFEIGSPQSPSSAQMAERVVSLACRINRQITGGAVKPTRVMFTHAPLSPLATYKRHFGLTPSFRQGTDGYYVTAADLNRPFASPDIYLQSLAERYLTLHPSNPDRSFLRQARETLARLLHLNARVTLDDLADALGLHPRALQRRLAAEGGSFAGIRDDARRDLAERYLTYDLIPLAQVAQLLGYADQTVLTRSCLRWFGVTPLRMRQKAARAGG